MNKVVYYLEILKSETSFCISDNLSNLQRELIILSVVLNEEGISDRAIYIK